MSKLTLTGFMLPLLLFASPDANSNNSAPRKQTIPESRGQSGTLQKMIVESGTVIMDLDMDRLNADGSLAAKVVQLRFDVAANSFFSILVFNDLLRGPEQGSMALVPQYSTELPSALTASISQLLRGAAGPDAPVPGLDVIVGQIESVEQFGSAGTQVGLAAGTDSCNIGDQPVDWFQLPNTDHPVVPQNLYRMSSGANNNERFEQIGHSWMKHTFFALEDTVCGACNTSNCETGTHLCPGCSDPYTADLNGDQSQIGSRAWVNPFTGSFPSGADNHSGHAHDGVSHRIRVEVNDLNTNLNP